MTTGLLEHSAPPGGAAFDWYSATVETPAERLIEALAVGLGADVHDATPMHGYERGYELRSAAGTVARVLAGGNGGKPHAWGSGAAAETFAALVRDLWGADHEVTRLDSRMDFGGVNDEETIWDGLYAACVDLAADRGLKTSLAGDYLGKTGGRTLYIGSRKSNVYVRLYEKGKQMQNQAVKPGEVSPLDWVRMEVQVRPKGEARVAAASVDPVDAWGFAVWTQELASRVADLDAARTPVHVMKATEDERAYQWMIKQYGPALERLAAERGWYFLLQDIKQDVRLNSH